MKTLPIPAKYLFFIILFAVAISGCKKQPAADNPITPDPKPDTKPPVVVPEDNDKDTVNNTWAAYSHANGQKPLYDTVFKQDKVGTLEIKITAEQWTKIRANMKTIYGNDFGQPGGTGGGINLDDYPDPDYVPATVKCNGKKWLFAGFRLKGNSSLRSLWTAGNYKMPFRLNMDKFEDAHPSIKNQRFYGFTEFSMSPGFNDNSLIREKVVADIYRMAGVPAARTAFYKVYIDYGDGLKFRGTYTMCEIIDDTMVKDQFGEDKGNIYKPLSTLKTFEEAKFEKKNNKTAANYDDVKAFVDALNSPLRTTDAAQWRASLDATFNTSHFLNWLAVSAAIINWDIYGFAPHNYYLYNSPTGKLTWIPWDHNEALNTGFVGGNRAGAGIQLNSGFMTAQNAPLIRYLAEDPVYFAKYKQLLKKFKDDVFKPAVMDALFEKNSALIAPGVDRTNDEKVSGTAPLTKEMFSNELNALKAFVVKRNADITAFTN
ncbi:MAG: CotH kinase family protein [Bacteroidota bacterium]